MAYNFRKLSNKDLLAHNNKLRAEAESKRRYGHYGTGRYVSNHEFWRGHISELRAEVERRRRSGQLRASAGKVRHTAPKRYDPLGVYG